MAGPPGSTDWAFDEPLAVAFPGFLTFSDIPERFRTGGRSPTVDSLACGSSAFRAWRRGTQQSDLAAVHVPSGGQGFIGGSDWHRAMRFFSAGLGLECMVRREMKPLGTESV